MAKILIIDDDPTILGVFKRFLEAKGHSVDVAANGQEGLDIVSKTPMDLIVTDIMMPDKDGLEVLIDMRKDHPDVPVIAISGGMHVMPIDFLPLAKKFGACKVLYKPIELEDLHAAIEEALEGCRSS